MKLCIPEKILDQHLVGLGKTGAGKSTMLRHIVEHLLSHKKRVCIIDPKGDWWGLKSSADGKSAGFPVIAFGDFKEPKAQDVPINAQSGKHVAELITSGNRPCMIGFRGWMTSHMTRFWIDFASTIFNSNEGELFLVVDEFHNFAPKGKIMDPEAGKCLHWSNRLLSEGRGLGVVCLTASQRPQKVHNDSLTSHETLIAMRVIHAADRQAIKDWIDGCGDAAQGKEVLNSLASLARGEAWVWSPEIGFGPTKVKFPMFETFDSFAPPQLQKKITDSGWADVNLETVKEKLASVIQDAKANDPKELKQKLLAAETELRRLKEAGPKIHAPATVRDVPIFDEDDKRMLKSLSGNIEHQLGLLGTIQGALQSNRNQVAALTARVDAHQIAATRSFTSGGARPSTAMPARAPVSPTFSAPAGGSSGEVGKCELAILRVLAQYDQGCEIGKLALLSGYRVSGGFRNSLSALRTLGAIEGDNTSIMRITPKGQGWGPFDALPQSEHLRQYWLTHRSFGKCEQAILRALLEKYPQTIDELAKSCEPPYEVSGGFRNALSCLRTAGVITGRNTDEMRPCDELLEA